MQKPPSRASGALAMLFLLVAIVVAIFATAAQALPPGVHCVAATAANQLTPPPAPWELRHEPRPAHLPPPLCPAGEVPTAAPMVSGASSVGAVPPITASPKPLGGEIKPFSERTGTPSAPFYYAGDGYHTINPWYGLSVGIQVGNPTLSTAAGTHSLGQIAVATPNVEYSAELGWHRDEGFGAGSRLFTYINKDKYKSNGLPGGDCYNCITPQEGAPYTQNQELTIGSTYQFTVSYQSGSWWFGVGPSWIGHESSSFWSNKFVSSTWMTMYGEVYDTTGAKTQMGNGIIGTTPGSLVMKNPIVYKEKGELVTTKAHANQKENPYPDDLPYYNVGQYSANEREWHYGGE